jgi:hypothetical protein
MVAQIAADLVEHMCAFHEQVWVGVGRKPNSAMNLDVCLPILDCGIGSKDTSSANIKAAILTSILLA